VPQLQTNKLSHNPSCPCLVQKTSLEFSLYSIIKTTTYNLSSTTAAHNNQCETEEPNKCFMHCTNKSLNINTCRVGQKNVTLYFCSYLRQLLIDFQNFLTGTLCRQFAITWLLHSPPHRKCVSTLTCKISMTYTYITLITNKHFGKIEKKAFQTFQWRSVCHQTVWV